MRRYLSKICFAAAIISITSSLAFPQRTELKPGMNFFSPQQDVELGQQVARDAERKIPMLNDSRVDDYLNRLGRKLAANAPGERFPYQFKCVNDSSINAFALPGGFLFVNRGVIEAADNEAELAGVIGHEIGHVALRHGTNQASKQYIMQMPLAVLGARGNSVGAILAQIGTGFALNSVLLKYSRNDERQADLMGAQILYDTNYNPKYLATFFDKLDSRGGGSDFFSSHPNPENRIKNINTEITKLGTPSSRMDSDSNEFQSIKRYVKSLPAAPKGRTGQGRDRSQSRSEDTQWEGPPERPSTRFRDFEVDLLSVRHPDNWESFRESEGFKLAPRGGIVGSGDSEAVAYGAIMSLYPMDSGSRAGLRQATDDLVRELQSSNKSMRMSRDRGQIRVGGQSALSRLFINDSPLGGREINWIVTSLRPEGLVYFIFVAPEQEFGDYERAFQQILDSVYYR